MTHDTTAQESGRKRNVTVLIVEDDAVLREFLRTALADEFDVVDAVLVMTAFSDIDPSEAEAAGADKFLSKPFDLLELTETVRELIGQDR